ncbi:MAG: hypothetical protein ACREDQ_11285 [Limisphaerales bacterium]
MNSSEILDALRELTSREQIEFLPLAPDSKPHSVYQPINKYLLDLKNGAKPESAAEDLFTALCKDVLGFQPTRQVGVMEGFVDFVLPEATGEHVPLELKSAVAGVQTHPQGVRRQFLSWQTAVQ